MTDIRSLSGSLNVTAGSGIRDSEGGATFITKVINCSEWLVIDTITEVGALSSVGIERQYSKRRG